MPYASTANASTASGYKPAAGNAAPRSSRPPIHAIRKPINAPATSSNTINKARTTGECSCARPELTATTISTVGASLSPDSASSVPSTDDLSGTLRRTENTAAASVGDVTAPISTDVSQLRSSR